MIFNTGRRSTSQRGLSSAKRSLRIPYSPIARRKVSLMAAVFVAASLAVVISVALDVGGFATALASQRTWARHLLSAGPGFAVLGSGLGWLAFVAYRRSEVAARITRSAMSSLEASEDRYRTLVELSPYAIYVQVNEHFVYANPAAIELFGVGHASDLIGAPVSDHFLSVSKTSDSDRVTTQGGLPAGDIKSQILKADGTIADVELVLATVEFDGKPGAQVIARDLTERRRSQRALERYRLLAESAGDIVFFIEEDGHLTDVNRAAELAYGYSRNELLAMNVATLRDPDEILFLREQLNAALKENGGIRFQTRHVRKDGSKFDVEVDSQSAVIGGVRLVVSVCRDITTRRQAEESLRESEERYRGMMELMPVPMVIVGRTGVIRFANNAASRLVGVQYLEGALASNFISEETGHAVVRELARAASGRAIHAADVIIQCGDGSPIDVDVVASRYLLDGESIIQAIVQPASARRQTELALRRSLTDTVHAMAQMVEARDPYTAGHQNRVQCIAEAIARDLGLDIDQITAVNFAAMVHDLGKINVPAEILSKPGRLDPEELALIRSHSRHGYDIVKTIPFPWPIADIVLQHHERIDGSGYPQGLKGAEICLEARIVAVADVVEAVASHRPYRPALGLDAALDIVREGSGTLFDHNVVEACVRVISSSSSKLGLEES